MILYINYYFLHYSEHTILRDMWPEGAKAVTEVTKRPKSTGTIFKESMIALVANLKTKVINSSFVNKLKGFTPGPFLCAMYQT